MSKEGGRTFGFKTKDIAIAAFVLAAVVIVGLKYSNAFRDFVGLTALPTA